MHTSIQIANSYYLWEEYVDPLNMDSEEWFASASLKEKLDIISECFGADSFEE